MGGSLWLPMGALVVLLVSALVVSDDKTPIPENKAEVEGWFKANVGEVAKRKGTLDPALEAAEAAPRIVKVNQAGGGDFKTIAEAVKSIPTGNTKRVIIKIAAGEYKEKITIDKARPYVTLIGEPGKLPILTFDGSAAKYGTMESATLIVWATNFVAANLIIKNTSPKPEPGMQGQALAMRINGDKAAFYNCKFYGFQDTLCDDIGNHFFKDCYVEGTYDFIFGRGASLYVNTQLHVVGDGLRVITAHNRNSESQKIGFAFVHCKITGVGTGIYLGRSWASHPKVIYAYTEMSSVVHPTGWKDNVDKKHDKTVFYGEYKCSGAGATPDKRVGFTQEIDQNEANLFLSLGYIGGSKWLLPPPAF